MTAEADDAEMVPDTTGRIMRLTIPSDAPWTRIYVRFNYAVGHVDLEQGDHHMTVDRSQAPALIAALQRLIALEEPE